MSDVDSGDYEVILDQPDASSAEASSEVVARTSDVKPDVGKSDAGKLVQADSKNATPGKVNASGEPNASGKATTPELTETALADATSSVGSGETDPADSSETPVATPTPSAQAGSDIRQGAAKPVGDAEPTEPVGGEAAAEADSDSPTAEKPKQSKSRVVTLLIPDKKFKTVGPDNVLRVSFDDLDLLKVLNMDPVTEDAPSRMPKWLKDLDGKRIRLKGFMYPQFEETGIRGFVFARDNEICCFGRDPLVYDLVDVFLRKGETTDYIQNRPFDVVGVFHIGDSIAPGELYSIDDAVVID